MKVLIGDDSMTQRVMLETIVRQWGFEAILAEDGQQAWDILAAPEAPRLVVLDWEMPGIDGLEVCRRVRARQDSDPPYILLLTARSDTADVVEGLDAGANDYLPKPFENTELRARLQVGVRMLDLQRDLIDARKTLEYQATHDTLTGLLNRGATMQAMAREMQRAKRKGQPLQVGLIDIDYFKRINDSHGHLTGDAVLEEIARRFELTLRPYDRIGRYGGEEFLVLVDSDYDDAATLFERLRLAIAEEPFEQHGASLQVTISGGFTSYRGGEGHDCAVGELLATADAALYQAKTEGRNRILFRDVDNPSGSRIKTA